MEDLKLFIKGLIIGVGKIIPGVSGAVFAMIFGVYEKAINIISDLKKLRGNLKFMVVLGSSIVLSVIGGSYLIKCCLDKYYFYTMFLFVGMMTSGINPLFKNLQNKKVSKKNIIFSLLVVCVLIAISFVNVSTITNNIDNPFLNIIILIFCGMVDALGTVIPGVCGTALLIVIGYYDKILMALSNILLFKDIINSLSLLIPFVIGLIAGVFFISKLINYLFEHQYVTTYCSIIGMSTTSAIILLIETLSSPFKYDQLIIGIIFLIIGYIITNLLDNGLSKKKEKV